MNDGDIESLKRALASAETERDAAREELAKGKRLVEEWRRSGLAYVAALEAALDGARAELEDLAGTAPPAPRCSECGHDEAAHGMRSATCGEAMCLCHGWKPARPDAPPAPRCTCGERKNEDWNRGHATGCPAKAGWGRDREQEKTDLNTDSTDQTDG